MQYIFALFSATFIFLLLCFVLLVVAFVVIPLGLIFMLFGKRPPSFARASTFTRGFNERAKKAAQKDDAEEDAIRTMVIDADYTEIDPKTGKEK